MPRVEAQHQRLRPAGARGVLVHFLWSQGAQAITILTGVTLARVLGPSQRGLLAAAMLWPGILANLAFLGIPAALTARVRKRPETVRNDTLGALLIATTLGVIETVIFFPLIPYLVPESAKDVVGASRLYLSIVPLSHAGWIAATAIMASGRFQAFGLLTIAASLSYLAFLIVGMLSGEMTFQIAIYAVVGSIVVSALINLAVATPIFRRGTVDSSALALLGPGSRYGFEQVMMQAIRQIEQWLILRLLVPEALGYYVIALSFASMSTTFASSLAAVLFIRLSEIPAEDRIATVARLFRQSLLVQWLPGLLFIAAAPLLIPMVFGPRYAASVSPVYFLIPALAVRAQSGVLLVELRSTDRAIPSAWLQFSGVAAFIPAAAVLIALLGIVGCSLAVLVAAVTELCVVLWFFGRDGYSLRELFGVKRSDLSAIRVGMLQAFQ